MSAFLEITTWAGACPNWCEYCPQEVFTERYDGKHNWLSLSLEDFKTAVNKLPEGSTIAFSGFSEPATNMELADMILYAAETGHKVMLLTTLVGMTMQDYERICQVEFEHFSVHLPDGMRASCINITDGYLNLLDYVSKAPPRGTFLFNHHGGDIHPDLRGIVRFSYLLDMNDRAASLEGTDAITAYHSGPIRCSHRFIDNYPGGAGLFLPNGDVYLCCQDFGLKHRLGNLLDQSWAEIMESEEMKRVRRNLPASKIASEDGSMDYSQDIICRRCSMAVGT